MEENKNEDIKGADNGNPNEEIKIENTEAKKEEDHKDKKTGEKVMSVLAYIGILVIIPLLASKDKPNVKFHIKQGLVLVVISAIVWILGYWIMLPIWPLLKVLDLGILILSIIGIINAIQNKQKNLPLVGQFAKHFNF
jgi:uncharacterized membrane protein